MIIGLGLLASGLTYILYYYIIEELRAVTNSSVAYIPPVVALVIGYFFINKNIGLIDCLGTGFMFASIFIVNRKKQFQV